MTAHAVTDLVLLATYVVVSVIGLHLLKTSAGMVLSVPFLLGLGCYGTSSPSGT